MTTKIPFIAVVFLAVFSASAFSTPAQTAPAASPREYSEPHAKEADWVTSAVRARKGMVVSDETLASAAGVKILKHGGNAVDAAVAVAFALAVVEPQAGNIGGGGFMLVRLKDGQSHFVDYREMAPAKASRGMYMESGADKDASVVGWKSVGIPGTVAGLALALKTYGTKSLPEVMKPAIELAAKGFPVDKRLAALLQDESATLGRFPTTKRIFLKNGTLYKEGEILRQPELAATLRRIAKNGPDEFYKGKTAHDLAAEMERDGGIVTLDDLASYQPKIRDPLLATYKASGHDWQVITSPPPSSGGVAVIEELNILSPVELKGWDDASSVHWVIEAMRRAFADRAEYLADGDFAKIPVRGLTSVCYADALRKSIDNTRASDSKLVKAGNPAPYEAENRANGGCPQAAQSGTAIEPDTAARRALAEAARGGHTTHFSVVDAAGNAVANTYTLNDNFGSAVTSSDGFFLNDEMDDFTAHPGSPNMFGLTQSEANTIAPGKRPLSSMTPTIVLRDSQLSFVTGSPGGPTIISAVLLTILNWVRLGMDAQSAINAPRFHQQWLPDFVGLEPIFSDTSAKELEARGFKLFPAREWIGEVEAIGIDAQSGERLGAADQRRKGSAIGY
ncbi:MAG TPA: gamma-glutamyltransferase [Candidatus Acidoferrales bacterium]